jgi:pimeloyl-ACP methyl ester carboxylesterase
VRRIVFIDAGIYVKPSAGEALFQLPLGIGRALVWHGFGGGPMSFNTQPCKKLGCNWAEFVQVTGTTDALQAAMASHRAYTDSDELAATVRRIGKPALVIWGEKDNIVPLSDGERLAADTGGRLLVINDKVHLPHLTAPAEVGAATRAFLEPR